MNIQLANEKGLRQEDFSKLIFHCPDKEQAQSIVKELKQADMRSCPPSSILALYIIQDLFSETSTDEANINRITTNLEAMAEDLYTTSRFVKSLR